MAIVCQYTEIGGPFFSSSVSPFLWFHLLPLRNAYTLLGRHQSNCDEFVFSVCFFFRFSVDEMPGTDKRIFDWHNDTHISGAVYLHIFSFLLFSSVLGFLLDFFFLFSFHTFLSLVDNAIIIVHRSVSVENWLEMCHAVFVCLVQARIFFRSSCIWHWFEVWWKASWKRMSDGPTIIKFLGKYYYCFGESQMAGGLHARQSVYIPMWTHFCIPAPRCWEHMSQLLQCAVCQGIEWSLPCCGRCWKLSEHSISSSEQPFRCTPDTMTATISTDTAIKLAMQLFAFNAFYRVLRKILLPLNVAPWYPLHTHTSSSPPRMQNTK